MSDSVARWQRNEAVSFEAHKLDYLGLPRMRVSKVQVRELVRAW
jgi:hypothetical protein